MKNLNPPQKGTADPLFQGIGSRICIMENEKKQFNGIIKHSLFRWTSPTWGDATTV